MNNRKVYPQRKCLSIFCLCAVLVILLAQHQGAFAQLLGAGYQTVIKAEYQYSDYMKYTYPDPILYEYPDVLYYQPLPFIASFPEHRFFTKITQYFGFRTSLGLRYQIAQLDDDTRQKIFYTRLTRELNDQFSAMLTYQFMDQTDRRNAGQGFSGHMIEGGASFNFAGAILIEGSYGYYSSSYVSPEAEDGGAHSILLNIRQVLTATTAIQVKYNYFYVAYSKLNQTKEKFFSNTVTIWLSQYLPTETAIHLGCRLYGNSNETRSFSPSIDINQVLNWKTVLQLSYRYYKNNPQEEILLQRLRGTSFSTNAYSLVLEYELSANQKIMLKYRYYRSDQNISMNTYLVSMEQIL